MNGHCGITGSTYRPVEQSTYAPAPRTPSGIQILGAFVACLILQAMMLLWAKDQKGRTNLSKLAETLFWFACIVGFVFLAVQR